MIQTTFLTRLDLQMTEQIGDLQLATERRARVAVRHRFEIRGAVAHDQPEGRSAATIFHVARLVVRTSLQPLQLRRTEDRRRGVRASAAGSRLFAPL